MVEYDLAKVEAGVQFPSPAPLKINKNTHLTVSIFFVRWACYQADGGILERSASEPVLADKGDDFARSEDVQ